jgi:chromosome segregation ATPase
MNTNAAADQDSLYYLYINHDWQGPYSLSDIRRQVEKGEVSNDVFAYAATQQRHFLVEELLLAQTEQPASSESASAISSVAPAVNTYTPDDVVEMAPEQATSFEHIQPDLRAFYLAYLALTEHGKTDPHQAVLDLRSAHQRTTDQLAARSSDLHALSRLINEIDEVGDYLANRQQLTALWQRLSELEKIDIEKNSDNACAAAHVVLKNLLERAEKEAPEDHGTSSVLLDLEGLDDEADSVITRKILLSARSEVANAKRDIDAIQQAYTDLQEQHAKDLTKARSLLEKAEAARAEEKHLARQTAAEVRNLAAEIQRLASEPDILGSHDKELIEQIEQLTRDLSHSDVSALAYIAEDVLIRVVAHLRLLIEQGGGDSGPLRMELQTVREALAEAKKQVGALTAECDALRTQYEQQRIAAEKASERARDREHRLRSTVTAMEVTKELHHEVMEDLTAQLKAAQARVEVMEKDLTAVRGEMKDSTGSVEARGKAIEHEMQRMVEMKAMLEVRSHELSTSLKNAEDELARAQVNNSDAILAEALAQKINVLRQTYDTTTARLLEQEKNAERLSAELAASRAEASELRARSDSLSGELSDARTSLTTSKRRLEELHEAYARLEEERKALQTELHQRRGTDTIRHLADEHSSSERLTKLEQESLALNKQLAKEKRALADIGSAKQEAEERARELVSERNQLQEKLERLQKEHDKDCARHSAALALSTQAAIESERRLNELQKRIGELEQITPTKAKDLDALEPSTARHGHVPGGALETDRPDTHRDIDQTNYSELQSLRAERDQLRAELDALRTEHPSDSFGEHNVAERLHLVEDELTTTHQTVKHLEEKIAQANAERERIKREMERLKGEREAAAVEHRVALKSARDKLTEEQARVVQLEAKLADISHHGNPSELQIQLKASLREQERLSGEVQKLAHALAKIHQAPSDRDHQLIEIAKASQQLTNEQERVSFLTRSFMDSLQQAESARSRTLELEQLVTARTSERDRLRTELDRMRANISVAKIGDQNDPHIAQLISERDNALLDLEQTRKDLDEVRGRLSETSRISLTAQQLTDEHQRIRTLERQIEELHSERTQQQQMFNEAKARMVQALTERDELAAELGTLRNRPDHGAELKMLKRRLLRAKREIKRLRKERDELLAERNKSATNLYELSAQIERLKGAQRAAAEALGLPVPPELPGHATGYTAAIPHSVPDTHATPVPKAVTQRIAGAAGFTSSHLRPHNVGMDSGGLAATPAMVEGMPARAVTRRIFGKENNATEHAFTSAYGKPAITGRTDNPTTAPHGTLVLEPKVRAGHSRSLLIIRGRPWRTTAIVVAAASMCAFFIAPPFIPLSTHGVVNAPITTITAPIAGRYFDDSPALNNHIAAQQILGAIKNDQLDLTPLTTIQAKLASHHSKQKTLRAQITDSENELVELGKKVDAFLAGRITQVTSRLNEETKLRAAYLDQLAHANDVTRPGLQAVVDTQSKTITELEQQLATLSAGQLIDAEKPAIMHRHAELAQKIALLKTQEQEFILIDESLQRDVIDEERRIQALKQDNVINGNGGILFARRANDGQWLKAGDPVATIADAKKIMVEAILHERYRDRISPGDHVEIQLLGERRRINGTVTGNLEPIKPHDIPMAATLSTPLQHHFKVNVLPSENVGSLVIGQGVKLIVTGKDPGIIKELFAWAYGETRF